MQKNIIILFLSFNILLSHKIYKEIKINNESMMNHLHDIGIHVDHAIINDDYVQFVVSEYDLEKIDSEERHWYCLVIILTIWFTST